jgi:hypothetical protein
VARIEEPRVRLLAALFPRGDERTWAFRLSGAEGDIAPHAGAFERFLETVRFDDKGDPPVRWTVPEGWKEEPGRDLRYATLRLGAASQAPELTVTKLEGKDAGSVLANVNRWRGQLGLRPVADEELGQFCKPLKIEGAEGTLVDMVGRGSIKTMKPPPPPPTVPEPHVGKKAPLTYKAPAGWKETRETFAVAGFQVGEGPQMVKITVTPAGGSVPANVNRWREQTGLPPLGEAELNKELRAVKVGGTAGVLVDLPGPKIRITGVIVPHQGTTWFFKMTGADEQVAAQREAFDAFLESVRFEGP